MGTDPVSPRRGAGQHAQQVADRLAEELDNWRQGAEGERKVGEILEGLQPAGWHVIHDVSLGHGNIDHVLVGPGGAFTVETKSHRGALHPDQIDRHMLGQAYAEKKLLEKVSGLEVEALLVFSEAWLIGSSVARRRGVVVLSVRSLVDWLERRPEAMAPERVAETAETLRIALEVDAVG